MVEWNKYKTISLILGLVVIAPIWFYLMWYVIKSSNPDRLVWFLFWIYIPAHILTQIISKIGETD